jgi:hypothetical protein
MYMFEMYMPNWKIFEADGNWGWTHVHTLKYRATRTALTPRLNTGAPEGQAVPATLMEPAR